MIEWHGLDLSRFPTGSPASIDLVHAILQELATPS